MRQKNSLIESFDFKSGQVLAKKYSVIRKLGEGWESEVYLLRECSTGIDRAAKFFFPHRNPKNKNLIRYAKKLHRLRHCPIMIQYYTQETMHFRGHDIHFLISEFIEGEILKEFIKKQPGKRLNAFQAVHLLHSLIVGLQEVHRLKEYHGDLHLENIMVNRFGLGFELKLLDMYHWNALRSENIQDDICDVIKIFYDVLGGSKTYAKQPDAVKSICCGLKKSLILKRFPRAAQLRLFLENLKWD